MKLVWTEQLIDAFEKVKKAIENCVTLYFMNPSVPILLETDASDYSIGAHLFQLIGEVKQSVALMSKSFDSTQRNWSTIEKEAYAIFYALQKMPHLLQDVRFRIMKIFAISTKILPK